MRRILSVLTVLSVLAPAAAMAEPPHHHFDHGRQPWHGDIARFHERDFGNWRNGNWYMGLHEGRRGWWWIAGGGWYYYPAPVYPYPDPYVPPTVIMETAPSPGSAYTYYCPSSARHYPYVTNCTVAWIRSEAPIEVTLPPQTTTTVITTPAPSGDTQRDLDFRQLNRYADEFHHTTGTDKKAKATLKNLSKRVDAFRQTLYKRDYNAMGALHDTEDLLSKIAAKRAALTTPPETEYYPAH